MDKGLYWANWHPKPVGLVRRLFPLRSKRAFDVECYHYPFVNAQTSPGWLLRILAAELRPSDSGYCSDQQRPVRREHLSDFPGKLREVSYRMFRPSRAGRSDARGIAPGRSLRPGGRRRQSRKEPSVQALA